MRRPSSPPSIEIALAALAALAALLGPLGCLTATRDAAVPLVRAHAASDLDCPDQEIRIEQELTGYFKAIGCGRKARYRAACQGLSCVVSEENDQVIPWRDRPEPDEPHR